MSCLMSGLGSTVLSVLICSLMFLIDVSQWRGSSVWQSSRLIPGVSLVQIQSPLPNFAGDHQNAKFDPEKYIDRQ